MKKHSARVAPLSACNSPVLTLTKVEGMRSVLKKALISCLPLTRAGNPLHSVWPAENWDITAPTRARYASQVENWCVRE